MLYKLPSMSLSDAKVMEISKKRKNFREKKT